MAISSCETYIELLSTGGDQSIPAYQPPPEYSGETGPQWDVTYLPTFRPLNTNDYDGSPTYKFEITANNASLIEDVTVHLVDELGTVHASIVVPAGTVGASDPVGTARAGWDFFRDEASFTPLSGDHQYGIRIVKAHTGWEDTWGAGAYVFCMGMARIKIRQGSSPTKSRVHIPLFDEMNGNGANSQYDVAGKPDSQDGVASVSTGYESLNSYLNDDGVSTPTYPDCEIVEPEHLTRNIFKYEESFLKPVSKVVFDASVGYEFLTSPSNFALTVFGVLTLTGCKLGLWKSDGDYAAATGGTGWQTATPITADGHTYTYVGGEFYWRVGSDPLPETYTVHIDPASVNAGDYIYVAGLVDVYTEPDPAEWGPWQEWNNAWQIPIVAGQHVSDIYLRMTARYNEALERNEVVCSMVVSYEVDSDTVSTVNVALWDLTADAIVASSELTWDEYTPWARKSVEIDLDEFIDGHEYIVRWKTDGNDGSPQYSDANLWISVDPIENFASWLRVMHGSNNTIINWFCYGSWGERLYAPTDAGSVSNNAMGVAYLPSGCTPYFEATVYLSADCLQYYSEAELAYFRAALWDIGTEDNAIGSESVPEIVSSIVRFTAAGLDDGHMHRVRSGVITGLVDGNRYGNNQPFSYSDTDDAGVFPAGGFLIVKYGVEETPVTPSGSKGIEYFANHELFHDIRNAMFVHCGLVWNGGTMFDITNIQTGSLIVTAPGHDFQAGDKVRIYDVVGMTEANSDPDGTEYYEVDSVDGDNFTIDIDSTGFSAYVSGGTVGKVGNSVSGLPTGIFYDGRLVRAVGDGRYEYNGTGVASGALTLPFYANIIIVGLPFRMVLEPNNPAAGSSLGSVRGKQQKINAVTLAFYETVGCEIGMNQDALQEIAILAPGVQSLVTHFETGILFSDDMTFEFDGDWDRKATISIVSDNGMPFLLKAVIPELNLNEPPA